MIRWSRIAPIWVWNVPILAGWKSLTAWLPNSRAPSVFGSLFARKSFIPRTRSSPASLNDIEPESSIIASMLLETRHADCVAWAPAPPAVESAAATPSATVAAVSDAVRVRFMPFFSFSSPAGCECGLSCIARFCGFRRTWTRSLHAGEQIHPSARRVHAVHDHREGITDPEGAPGIAADERRALLVQ